MPAVSVITPSNSTEWLMGAFQSLQGQSFRAWEWVIVPNGSVELGPVLELAKRDSRIVVLPDPGALTGNVGALKRAACDRVQGNYVVEFDHDDELDDHCLEEVVRRFESTSAAFVYSRTAYVDEDGRSLMLNPRMGWEYDALPFRGVQGSEKLLAARNPPLLPQNIARLGYAPCHVRAWRRESYRIVGGHDPALHVCDDQDLMCRLYLGSGGSFSEIDRCLYKYRRHSGNTFERKNPDVKRLSRVVYDRYFEALALMHWGRSHRCITLATDSWSEAGPAGMGALRGGKLDGDHPWPFQDGELGVVLAIDVLHTIRNKRWIFREAHRCLAHGGVLITEVPSADGRGLARDPRTVSLWSSASFDVLCEPDCMELEHAWSPKDAASEWRGSFQAIRLCDHYPTQEHRDRRLLYTKAHLVVRKNESRFHGPMGLDHFRTELVQARN